MVTKCSLISKLVAPLRGKRAKKKRPKKSSLDAVIDQTDGVFRVKVEVHSSSSGAGSDTNLSSPEISDASKTTTENEYEDIYVMKDSSMNEKKSNGVIRRGSRDSGSHSRSESISSTNSNVVIQVASPLSEKLTDNQDDFESGVSSASPSDLGHSEEEQEVAKVRAHHTLPHQHPNSRLLKRVVSEPGAIYSPPPPPPPLPKNVVPIVSSSCSNVTDNKYAQQELSTKTSVHVENTNSNRNSSTVLLNSNENSGAIGDSNGLPQSAQCEKQTSSLVTNNGGGERSTIVVANASSAEVVVQCDNNASTANVGAHLVNKQLVLKFIPPKFPTADNDSNSLIKPSEYLRSIAATGNVATTATASAVCVKLSKTKSDSNSTSGVSSTSSSSVVVEEKSSLATVTVANNIAVACVPTTLPVPIDGSASAPPPPPPPETEKSAAVFKNQPLSFISTNDLISVQLRKTEKSVATKTMSAPQAALQTSQSQPFQAQKQDLIAELKMSKDITGIKKLKVERVKLEEKQEKEMVIEIGRQFSIESFVEKIPDLDSTGNPIPPWKRQMLAKKAAEKAKKEMEEQVAREAENRRLQAIPAWKRQLMQSKKTDEKCFITHSKEAVANNTEMTVNLSVTGPKCDKSSKDEDNYKENDEPEGKKEESTTPIENDQDEVTHIIPWRAQLRKTNSRLNLLE